MDYHNFTSKKDYVRFLMRYMFKIEVIGKELYLGRSITRKSARRFINECFGMDAQFSPSISVYDDMTKRIDNMLSPTHVHTFSIGNGKPEYYLSRAEYKGEIDKFVILDPREVYSKVIPPPFEYEVTFTKDTKSQKSEIRWTKNLMSNLVKEVSITIGSEVVAKRKPCKRCGKTFEVSPLIDNLDNEMMEIWKKFGYEEDVCNACTSTILRTNYNRLL